VGAVSGILIRFKRKAPDDDGCMAGVMEHWSVVFCLVITALLQYSNFAPTNVFRIDHKASSDAGITSPAILLHPSVVLS
jgi:hypothetical protein